MFRAFQYFTLFLVGFTLPIGYALFGMTASKFATAVLLVLGILQFGFSRRRPPPDSKRVWLVVFTVSYAISSVVGLVAGIAPVVLISAGSTQAALIVFYLLLGYVVQNRRALVLLLWALVIGGAATAAPAVLGIEVSSGGFDYGDRYQGLSSQVNLLGFDMAVCVPLTGALFFAARSWLSRILLLGLGALCLAGMLLSLSRSALLSGAIMGGFWIWRSGRMASLRYLVPAAAVLGGLLLFTPQAVQRRMETVIDPTQRAADGSIQSRFVQVEWAAKAIAASPAVGVGVQRFMPWVQAQPGGRGMEVEIHTAYLAIAARQGLLGLLPFAAMLILTWTQYSHAIRLVRARRRLRDRELEALAHLATFLQIAFLGGLVGGLFHQAHISKTMWLLLALSPALVALCRARIAELDKARFAAEGSQTDSPELLPAFGPSAGFGRLPHPSSPSHR